MLTFTSVHSRYMLSSKLCSASSLHSQFSMLNSFPTANEDFTTLVLQPKIKLSHKKVLATYA